MITQDAGGPGKRGGPEGVGSAVLGRVVLLVLTLSVSLLVAEGFLRTLGFTPWTLAAIREDEPTLHEPHPTLGWRNKVGQYVVPAYDPLGEDIYVTFLEDGLRRTAPGLSANAEHEIVVVGGSFTQGWAISAEPVNDNGTLYGIN